MSGETADGDLTKYRQTVAADPRVIPLGSKVRIEGAGAYSGVYTVTDTGRKIQGNSVDVFIPSDAAAKQFGKKPVRVRILTVGDEKVGEKEAK
ncbi:MAG TPA: 3D domain-containing protein [Bryobacteraceae bacterium]|nr:3D domain-containing protein [Bryobacteraceae bacterium]